MSSRCRFLSKRDEYFNNDGNVKIFIEDVRESILLSFSVCSTGCDMKGKGSSMCEPVSRGLSPFPLYSSLDKKSLRKVKHLGTSCMLEIPAHVRLRWEGCTFEVSLDYGAGDCLHKQKAVIDGKIFISAI